MTTLSSLGRLALQQRFKVCGVGNQLLKLHQGQPFLKSSCVTILTSPTQRNMSSRPKVYVTRSNIPEVAMKILRDKCDVECYTEDKAMPRDLLLKAIKGKNGIFLACTEKVDKEFLETAGPDLKVIGTLSVGHDHVDLDEVKRHGIKMGYTPGVLTAATAELTIALLLATTRRLFEGHQALVDGTWDSWSPLWMVGRGLEESTVGIVGLGRIGAKVLEMLQPFGVKRFLYSGNNPKPEGDKYGAEFVSFSDLLKQSDFVIVMCPLNEKTKELIDEKALAMMKPSAVLVNTSRGGVVKQSALIDALKTGKIRAAGLDVMTPEPLPINHELTKLPNCVLIPHLGSATIQARTKMCTITAENIVAGLFDQPMPAQLC